jgi:hypothetical protein
MALLQVKTMHSMFYKLPRKVIIICTISADIYFSVGYLIKETVLIIRNAWWLNAISE